MRGRTQQCYVCISLAALLALSGCERSHSTEVDEPVQTAPGAPKIYQPKSHEALKPKNELPSAEAGQLLDGFEGPQHTLWAFDSADDEADAQYVAEGATQGHNALKLVLRDKGTKGKLHLRREVELDLSRASALTFDLTAPSDKLAAALAVKTDPGDLWQEAQYVALKQGLNRNVRFPLDAPSWKGAHTHWEYSGAPVNLGKVKRLILLLYTNGQESGSILVDNLRVETSGSVHREWRPEIVLAKPPPASLSLYQGLQSLLIFRASYRDMFDPADICVGLYVTSPSGKQLDVRGFFAGVLERSAQAPVAAAAAVPPYWGPFTLEQDKQVPLDNETPVWALRFTPLEIGRYTFQHYVRNKLGETRLPETSSVVVPEGPAELPSGRKGGMVRVSERDSRQLELSDRSPFFILGQNVAWTQNWTPYLEKIRKYGGNTCRIWLCPWGLNLERKSEPGSYELKEAKRLDGLLADAERTGVRLMFCFTFHGANTDFWHDSPYNQANGGPCARPEDFFTDRAARRQFQRLLAYAVARWGASPAVLAWELINEMDLAKFERPEDVAAWTIEMASYLKSIDPYEHLVTSSVSKPEFLRDVWRSPALDMVTVHGYGTDVARLLHASLGPVRLHRKPMLLAEFGGGWNPADDLPDQDGARLQAALWLSACSPSCGAALPWWWDTYLEARQLYPVLAAAARFVSGDDRRGRFNEWVHKRYPEQVEVSGILDSQGARLYVHNPDWTRAPETRTEALLKQPLPLELSGLIDGRYRLEFWDAKEGKPFSTSEAVAREGTLKLQLPARAHEFGLKIDRTQWAKPDLR